MKTLMGSSLQPCLSLNGVAGRMAGAGWRPGRVGRWLAVSLAVLAVVGGRAVSPAVAVTQELTTPPRVSLIEGEVSFWRPGAEEWSPARLNTALAGGDALFVGAGANLELQIGALSFARAGSGTELSLVDQEPGYLQLKVTTGRVALDVRQLPAGFSVELATPHGAFTIEHAGYYRADVGEDVTTFAVRRGGRATVAPAVGPATTVSANEEVMVSDTDTGAVPARQALEVDDWDSWNDRRTEQVVDVNRSYYLPPEVYGRDDLDRYGHWQLAPTYGRVWVPNGVAPDWAPYSTGRWLWDPYYHWTWVDDAPWGWAPYHYGRWVHLGGYWGWAPGPVLAAPVYAPALVAFFDVGPHVRVGLSTPGVAWVALGWGEPLIPWWGPVGYVGVPCWHGWHGPRFVNHAYVSHGTVVHAHRVRTYDNARYHNAVVARPRDRFYGHAGERVRIPAADARHLRPFRGALPVRPTAASLAPSDGRAQRPPDRSHDRRVVATRPGRDPGAPLRAAGLSAPPAANVPQPRLVTRPRVGRERPPGAPHPPAQPAPPRVQEHRPPSVVPRAPQHQPVPGGRRFGRDDGPNAPQQAAPPAAPRAPERRPPLAVPREPQHQPVPGGRRFGRDDAPGAPQQGAPPAPRLQPERRPASAPVRRPPPMSESPRSAVPPRREFPSRSAPPVSGGRPFAPPPVRAPHEPPVAQPRSDHQRPVARPADPVGAGQVPGVPAARPAQGGRGRFNH